MVLKPLKICSRQFVPTPTLLTALPLPVRHCLAPGTTHEFFHRYLYSLVCWAWADFEVRFFFGGEGAVAGIIGWGGHYQLGVWGSAVSSSSGVRGEAPGANDFPTVQYH